MNAPYPNLGPAVARLRRSDDRHAHGLAVLDAIRALQARDLAGALEPASRPRCASGTGHTDGDRILAALRQSHAAAMGSARGPERTEEQWRAAYAAAMAEKRAAEAHTKSADPMQVAPDMHRNRIIPARSAKCRPTAPPAYVLPRILGAVGVSFGYGA